MVGYTGIRPWFKERNVLKRIRVKGEAVDQGLLSSVKEPNTFLHQKEKPICESGMRLFVGRKNSRRKAAGSRKTALFMDHI